MTSEAAPFGGRARNVVLAAIVALDLLALVAAARPPRVSLSLDPAKIQPESGRAWIVDLSALDDRILPGFTIRSDSTRGPASSLLNMFGGDVALGPPHSAHADIRESGGGRFSHWGESLYFSTEDGSDPRTSGRVYRVETAVTPSPSAVLLLVLANLTAFTGRARRHPRLADASAALACAGIVLLAAVFRLDLTSCLGLPYWFPDSHGYVLPAVRPDTLPWSQMRTLGVPVLVRLALLTSGSPAGVLLLHHVLWLAGTVAILAVLLLRFRLRLVAVVLAVWLGFAFKDLQFEYSMLSEHAARCVNLLFCAIALAVIGRRPRVVYGLVLGLVVLAAVLVRPNAIALIAVAAVVLVWPPRSALRRRAILPGLVLGATLSAGLAVNAFGYHQRFGSWRLNEYDGFVLFCGFAHLIPMESAAEPEVGARLGPILEAYRVKYASRGEYLCNWLVFGSTNDEIRQELGPISPSQVIVEHVRSRGLTGVQAASERNRLMRALATEGIRSDPYGYARTVARFFGGLLSSGPDARYGDTLEIGSAERWIQSRREWAALVAPTADAGAPVEGDPGGRCLFKSAGAPPAGRQTSVRAIALASASGIAEILSQAASAWLVLLAMLAVAACRRPQRGSPGAVVVALVPAAVALTTLGWTALLGVSDPSRFFAPVQDLYVLSWLALPFAAASLARLDFDGTLS